MMVSNKLNSKKYTPVVAMMLIPSILLLSQSSRHYSRFGLISDFPGVACASSFKQIGGSWRAPT